MIGSLFFKISVLVMRPKDNAISKIAHLYCRPCLLRLRMLFSEEDTKSMRNLCEIVTKYIDGFRILRYSEIEQDGKEHEGLTSASSYRFN